MNTIDWLMSQGRDPLEVVLLPPAPDVAERLAKEEAQAVDRWIERELRLWPQDAKERLAELIQRRIDAALTPAPGGAEGETHG